MKPEQICTGMTHALERMIFQDVRARSPFAASFYPTPAAGLNQLDTQPIHAIIPSDYGGEGVLGTVSGIMGLTESAARNQILRISEETLDDEGFPDQYIGEIQENLRSQLIRLGYMCYLVGFEAGSSDQCAMFGEIVDTSVDQLVKSSCLSNVDMYQLAINKLVAATYFTEMMILGARSSEFYRSEGL